ncbi:hypothetical protein CYLTODRAFT_425652 [Cylindrobasidium torrendii FP15055 ss-10]|uniref:Uncharacterized protein n=1 Tax=Cylindrobasidium torrendii FP15055 ss-10 TaxID=1314674 RepID=A0A0D7B155_9AGAR|nr:hypothetical protein CYLTODRAFT_425652 [Cylindrobasidium torrendii FP15055 ss-10]
MKRCGQCGCGGLLPPPPSLSSLFSPALTMQRKRERESGERDADFPPPSSFPHPSTRPSGEGREGEEVAEVKERKEASHS